ncbi:MAG: hypothetical protein HQM09_17215 [Candidatus Riflebacteria bacterium]|nr:hypothetical protein [Candidatus Riflebacteria bacterium]
MSQILRGVILWTIILFPLQLSGETGLIVSSPVDGKVFVDNALIGSVDSAKPCSFTVSVPGSHVVEVRADGSRITHREEVTILPNASESREIKAFSDVTGSQPSQPKSPEVSSQKYVTREEMMAAIEEATQKATQRAKSEALSEEAARRRRAQKRDITNKAIGHVVGVEANRSLPGSVKRMERIKLLIEALPSFKK